LDFWIFSEEGGVEVGFLPTEELSMVTVERKNA
jgi:hypothetical protein